MSTVKPQVTGDEEHERVHDRVAAADVAKDAGVVCTRMSHRSRPGARQSAIWTVKARMGAVRFFILPAPLAADEWPGHDG